MSATSETSTPSTSSSATEEPSSSQGTSQTGNPQSGTNSQQRISIFLHQHLSTPKQTIGTNGSHDTSYSKQLRNVMGCQIRCVSIHLFTLWEIMPPTFIKASSFQVRKTLSLTLNKSLRNTSRESGFSFPGNAICATLAARKRRGYAIYRRSPETG